MAWNWDAILGIGSALIGANQAKKAQETSTQAQREAADVAYERALPWSTGGLFGAAAFDPRTRTALQTLSPELRKQYDDYMREAGTYAPQIPGYQSEFDRQRALSQGKETDYDTQMGYAKALEGDPFASGKKFYDMQKAVYAPEQEKARLSQEARLLSQGKLGSTGGAGQIEALRKAQEQVDLQAQLGATDKAQALIDTYRSRGAGELNTSGMFRGRAAEEQALIDTMRGRRAGDLGMVESLGQLPMKYAQVGQQIGTGMSGIAEAAANMQSGAAKQLAGTTAAGWGGLAGAVNSVDWNKTFAPQQQVTTYVPGGSYTGSGNMAVWNP
jgi:hypothetical protein